MIVLKRSKIYFGLTEKFKIIIMYFNININII